MKALWPWPIQENHDIDKLEFTAWKCFLARFNFTSRAWTFILINLKSKSLIILFAVGQVIWGEKVDNILRSDRETNPRQQMIIRSYLSLQFRWAENLKKKSLEITAQASWKLHISWLNDENTYQLSYKTKYCINIYLYTKVIYVLSVSCAEVIFFQTSYISIWEPIKEALISTYMSNAYSYLSSKLSQMTLTPFCLRRYVS